MSLDIIIFKKLIVKYRFFFFKKIISDNIIDYILFDAE